MMNNMFRWKYNSHDSQEIDAEHQQAKIKELKAAIGPLFGNNSKFCTDACFRRYLEARNWNVEKAEKMLLETLKWRTNYKPEEIRWHEVASEGETGKVYRANFKDRDGRTVLVMRPGKQNTSLHEKQIQHLVYLVENTILNLPENQDQTMWLIDFTGWSLSNPIHVKTARETISIMQNHYPERLAAAFLYNPPRIFETFWKIVKYFMDTKTFQKVKFIYPKDDESMELMHKHFDIDILPLEFGGQNKIEYNHEEFSKMMVEDDFKSARLWGLSEKTTAQPNQGDEVTHPEPSSRIAAQAS